MAKTKTSNYGLPVPHEINSGRWAIQCPDCRCELAYWWRGTTLRHNNGPQRCSPCVHRAVRKGVCLATEPVWTGWAIIEGVARPAEGGAS